MIRDVEIDAQLRRILESPAFVTSARSRQFLEFCVGQTLRGESSQLKETTIAVEVFLRSADYDPKSDPIVRVHARRVREKLDLYYRTAGTDDPIKIDLPKGGYVPQILRTLPRRKTEFADWEEPQRPAEMADAGAHKAAGAIPQVVGRSNLYWIGIGAAMLAVAVASFTLAWVWRGDPQASSVQLGTLKPVETPPGIISDAIWSPDGSQLAFVVSQRGDADSHIYLKNAGGGAAPVRLTEGDAYETRPVWSPNGREIAFVQRVDLSHFELIRFDLATRTARSIGRFVSYWPIPEDHPALDWSPDGKFLLTAEQTAESNPVRIVLVSLATGERIPLTSPPVSSSGDVDARFSPDGRWVAFRRGGLGDLYVVSIKGEQSQPALRLTFDMRGVRGIAWVDHGRSILFGTQRGSTAAMGLWEISKDGGPLRRVSPADFDAIDPTLSARGELLFEHRQLVTDLLVHSLTGTPTENVLLPSDSIDASPAYSPDGRSVVFTSTRSGWIELWLLQPGKAAPVQLTRFQGTGITFLPSWAPDGQSIVFCFRQGAATNLFVYNTVTKTLKQITSTRSRDMSPVYSSDGRYIYYSSNDDGTSRIWKLRADGSSRAEPLFLEATIGFTPSPDGKWLYYLHEEGGLTLLRTNLQDSTTEEVFHGPGRVSFLNDIVFANHRIYLGVSQSDPSSSEILEVDPDTKSVREAAHLRDLPPLSESGISGFSISPDGSKLIAGHVQRNETSLFAARFVH